MLYKTNHCASTFADFIILMKMMQEVSVDKGKEELRTIEIEPNNEAAPAISSSGKVVEPYSNFGQDMSGSDDDEASEVDSFILEDDSEQGLEASKFLLAAESDGQGIQTVDPQTQARLEALLEAAGISKLSSKDGKALSDPEVLRTLTSSVSSALDEAAQALHRMRDSQGQLPTGDGMHMEANGESESIGHRSGSGNVADASEEGESLLSLACSAGYYELAQVLLAMKANVEDRGIKGDCTPLMEAASGGHVDIVRLLLLHHADINAQSSAGNTPLHYGACGGFKDVVLELVMNAANVEIHNENGHTPLMEAASAGHVEVAKILLEHGAGINTHSNEFKESALTLACYKGHLEMVKFLLEAGADQEHKTDEMHTALMEASMDGHVEVARLLLDSGAQVNMPADSFESPLTLAACGGHLELAGLLIERGANIEEVNDEGYTPLMEAAREGHEDMVALLLSQGADINAQTEETQETALTLACCGGFLEVADFLLRSGAHIELGCSTPLMEAAQEGHLELVSFLLQSGANVEAQTGTGDTALTYACENGHTDVAEALLECGANLEHESEGGRTPLMKAARAGHLCTVQFLISKGADVNRATTSNDHTVLSLASAGGHLAVVELLLQHGADCNHKLKDGSTMVIEAAKGGHTQVVKLLLEWPNRYLVHSATDQLAHICVTDAPYEEPRVPVQGLANIVPPSEPDSQIPLVSAIHTKTVELSRQNLQKNLTKRLNGGQVDSKGGNKYCNPDNFQQMFFGDAGLINDRAVDKEENMCLNQPTKEEQILRKQQILDELKKVEQELQDKAQAHLLSSTQLELEEHHQQQIQTKLRQASTSFPTVSQFGSPNAVVAAAGLGTVSKAEQLAKQNEEIAKLLELPSHTIGLIDPHNLDLDYSKILAWNEENCAEASCPEACLQTVQAHLQQHQQQQGQLQRSAPPPPPLTSAIAAPSPGVSPVPETRGGGGKIVGTKRNGSNKQARTSKNSQPLQQSPPPPPPPPPPLSVVHSSKGSLLLPLATQQPAVTQAQSIVFHTDHNGVSQSADQLLAINSASQVLLDPSQCQQHQSLAQQVHLQQQQQQLLAAQQQILQYPQLIPQQQQDQLLHQMLNQSSLQHQLQLQHGLQQVQCGQPFLQGVASPQVAAAHTAQLSQQLLQQQLKPPSTSGAHSIALNKSQVRKQQRVAQTAQQNVIQQNSSINVDGSYPSPGILGTAMNSLYSSVDVDSQTESNHDTALTLACAGGHAELVSLLLSKGADIEHRDKKGFTPLILAATAGHVDVVEILLDHNADIEAQSERTKDTPLSLACSGGRYEVVELLLNRGANKEHRNVSDYTPLSLAASGGYVNIIRLLLNHNAEINSRTGSKLGISPLMLAAMNGHTAAVKLLLDQGSDINAQIETNRNTALTLACFQGRHEVVSLLVDRKANIEHRAKTGLTPLMEAASGGYVEVGRVLLDKGADVNAPPVPSSRDTALTIAADKGHYRFVELLLHRGAAVDVKNKKGNSPLWLACNGGHSDVVSLLVQADADIDSQDNRKVSCLMAAFRRGHIKVVKWMVKKVTQFPSENEIKRYIATITDKELQKKCNQCADIIVAAKERQAAEANKNADSLLEEIQQEKEQAALKAELASKRRERRRERKRKGKQRDEKNEKDKDSGKNSSPEPDGESNSKKDDDDEDEDEEDDSNSEPPMISVPVAVKPEPLKGSKVKTRTPAPTKCQSPPESQQSARVLPTLTAAVAVTTATSTASTASGPSPAAARASRDSRKKQQKAARESRCEGSDQDRGLRNVKAELSKKEVTQTLQVKVTKVTPAAELLVSAAGITCRPATMVTALVTSTTPTQVIYVTHTPKPATTSMNTNPVTQPQMSVAGYTSNKDNPASVTVNGGVSRARPKKSTDMIKQSSTTGIGDLDDFGVIPSTVLKSIDKINGTAPGTKKLSSDNKKDWIDEYRYFEKNMANRLVSSAPSPRKGQKKEDGWKEVIRKNVSKKLSVPGNVISRLIGKGGCNINAIRELSGAHVEIEKSKGAAERTVTIRGSPEAIRQANSLINAMIEEPDKDVSELLTRANKGPQKTAPEKPPSQKTPGSITDFVIGTFIIPTTSMHTSTSTTIKSPGQSKSGKQGGQFGSQANSSINTMGPTIGAWQNPVPGQVLPASPRRSPQKQVTPSSSAIGARSNNMESVEKSSARQLMFGLEPGKRPKSPVSAMSSSAASLNFTTTATSTSRGVVCTPLPNQTISKFQDQQRLQTQIKPMMPVGIPTTTSGVRFSRPVSSVGPRMEGLPLPIVTGGSTGHMDRSNQTGSGTPSSQPTPGEYSPFNNNMFTNFLTKKEEPADKMDFASVAAAGVVTTSPSPQTTTNPSPSTSSNTINDIDPALQAKAPGYKMPQQGSSPPYRPDINTSMGGYHMSPVGSNVTNTVQGLSSINSSMRPMAPVAPLLDDYQMSQMLHYQFVNQHLSETCNPMLQTALLQMGSRGLPIMPGVFHQGMSGISLQQLPQKEEYSKPHRPMTLPEIKGGLNPNAPEFQLSSNGPPMVNGFDRHPVSSMAGMVRMNMADGSGRSTMGHPSSLEGPVQNSGPNPGPMPPIMHPEMLGSASVQYLLHQQHPPGNGLVATDPGGSPQMVPSQMTSSLSSITHPHNSAQSMMGPPGLSPIGGGVANFMSQSQPQRVHTSLQSLAGGVRPSSAPSVQPVDPGIMSAPRSGSPLSTRTPPLDHGKLIQPIGGERRKGTGRPGPVLNAGSYSNLWSFGDSTVYSPKWSTSGSVIRAAPLPSAVMTTSVVSGGNMVYPGMPEAEEEVLDYGLQAHVPFNDTGIPGGDGDHNSMAQPPAMMIPAMYSNGPYPMAPIFPPKGIVGDSHTPPLWNPALTLVPSGQGDNERWQSWSQ